MATTNLVRKSIGDLDIEHGNGTPNHSSKLGSIYIDKDTGIHYLNNNGATGWLRSDSVTDSDLVHIAGVETITGLKTFADKLSLLTTTATDNLELKKSNSTTSWFLNAGRTSFFDNWLLFKNSAEAESFTSAITNNGAFRSKNNSAVSPTYSFTLGSNYGLYFSNPLARPFFTGISAAGQPAFRVDSNAAVGIGVPAANDVDTSAVLEIRSTTKGVLLPRMTATQAFAITPINGLVLYVTNTNATFTDIGYWVYEGGDWVKVTTSESRASMYISSALETTIATVSTPVKVNATSYAVENLTDFTESADGRLRYDGTATKVFDVIAAISMTASANKIVAFYVAKNGSVIAGTELERKVGTGVDVGALPLVGSVELATNDYIEIWVENKTDSTNVTATKMYVNLL